MLFLVIPIEEFVFSAVMNIDTVRPIVIVMIKGTGRWTERRNLSQIVVIQFVKKILG